MTRLGLLPTLCICIGLACIFCFNFVSFNEQKSSENFVQATSDDSDQDLGKFKSVLAYRAAGHSQCVLFSNRRIKCFGVSVGNLGYGDKNSRGNIPYQPGSLPYVDLYNITSLWLGYYHTCVTIEGSKLKCFGNNFYGQLGLGDHLPRGDDPDEMGDALPFVSLGSGLDLNYVCMGLLHTCIAFTNKKVKCVGDSRFGSIGQGSVDFLGDSPDETGDGLKFVDFGEKISNASDIFCGPNSSHNCVTFENGRVKCFGKNDFGQLGYGDTKNRGDKPNQMGENLPFIDIIGTNRVIQISMGVGHTCVLHDTSQIRCWGRNDSGQLGYGDVTNRGDVAYSAGYILPIVSLGTNVKPLTIVSGAWHNCILASTNGIKCWGANNNGPLGYASSDPVGRRTSDMGNRLPFVDVGLDENETISYLQTGYVGTCAILSSMREKCWGNGTFGFLGNGKNITIGMRPYDMGKNLSYVALFDTAAPTSAPTRSPTVVTLLETIPPSKRPTLSPTSEPLTHSLVDFILASLVPLTALVLLVLYVARNPSERKLYLTIGFSFLDVISDILYICNSEWISVALWGISIFVLFLPLIIFSWSLLRFSTIRPTAIVKYAPQKLDELFKAALYFVAWLIDEIIFFVATVLLTILFFPLLIWLKGFSFTVFPKVRRWVIKSIDDASIKLGYPKPPERDVLDEAYIINACVLSEVLFESLPQLVIALLNHNLVGQELNPFFVFSVTMSGISILNSIYPVFYMLMVSKTLRSALRANRYDLKALPPREQGVGRSSRLAAEAEGNSSLEKIDSKKQESSSDDLENMLIKDQENGNKNENQNNPGTSMEDLTNNTYSNKGSDDSNNNNDDEDGDRNRNQSERKNENQIEIA